VVEKIGPAAGCSVEVEQRLGIVAPGGIQSMWFSPGQTATTPGSRQFGCSPASMPAF